MRTFSYIVGSWLTHPTDSLILTFFPVLTIGPLKQKCEDMFNHPKDCGPVRRVLVFGILFELCIEYSENDKDTMQAKRYTVLARTFLAKLEKAISELPLIIAPSTEAVTSLIIGVSNVNSYHSQVRAVLLGSLGKGRNPVLCIHEVLTGIRQPLLSSFASLTWPCP